MFFIQQPSVIMFSPYIQSPLSNHTALAYILTFIYLEYIIPKVSLNTVKGNKGRMGRLKATIMWHLRGTLKTVIMREHLVKNCPVEEITPPEAKNQNSNSRWHPWERVTRSVLWLQQRRWGHRDSGNSNNTGHHGSIPVVRNHLCLKLYSSSSVQILKDMFWLLP